MESCRFCGSRLGADARWCGRCHEPVPDDEALPGLLHEVEDAKRWARTSGWRPDATVVAPLLPLARSRTRGGALSYGLPGRILLTAVLALPALAVWVDLGLKVVLGGNRTSVLTLLWALPLTAFVLFALRDVWRRQRVPHRDLLR